MKTSTEIDTTINSLTNVKIFDKPTNSTFIIEHIKAEAIKVMAKIINKFKDNEKSFRYLYGCIKDVKQKFNRWDFQWVSEVLFPELKPTKGCSNDNDELSGTPMLSYNEITEMCEVVESYNGIAKIKLHHMFKIYIAHLHLKELEKCYNQLKALKMKNNLKESE